MRCRGEWHTVVLGVDGPAVPHDEDELRREAALRALGGRSTGCHAVREAWATGSGRLPKALRLFRDDLFERVRHGDTEAALRHLDAGGDPRVRDRSGRTLLHHMHLLDHEALLPRLLEAGVAVDARDSEEQTPLFRTTRLGGPPALARALLAAGAATEGIGGDERHGDTFEEAVEWRSPLVEDPEQSDWEALFDELDL
ncbi:hypothetical protein PWG71_25140 [Nocardiopsis sp. N85]|uniref:hypothetical protein n=1 Tax=Nocardiopsis sp. N85 TaxID=3029400 RepID=UPI00237F9487|nr:hypothetical protein [Nocardiopsis sp. N85]MDE3724688.1 hypothetical protein [Nocardiopsis sp. N85]